MGTIVEFPKELFESHQTLFKQFQTTEQDDKETRRAILTDLLNQEMKIRSWFASMNMIVTHQELSSTSKENKRKHCNGNSLEKARKRAKRNDLHATSNEIDYKSYINLINGTCSVDSESTSAETMHTKKNASQQMATKEGFLRYFGLYTQKELDELKSRKPDRKRRTTANPRFSSDAIAKKNLHKQQINAQKKLMRMEMGLRKQILQFKRSVNIGGNLSQVEFKSESRVNCSYCFEDCDDSETDTIIMCSVCQSFFHLTCLSDTLKEAIQLKVKCRVCHKESTQNSTVWYKNKVESHEEFIRNTNNVNRKLNNYYKSKEAETLQLINDLNTIGRTTDAFVNNISALMPSNNHVDENKAPDWN